MNQRGLHGLLLAIPAVAVVWVGAIWFIGRATTPGWAALLWVAKTAPEQVLLRAQVATYPERSVARLPSQVTAQIMRPGASPVRVEGEVGADGVVDFDVDLPSPVTDCEVTLMASHDGESLVLGRWTTAELQAPLALEVEPTPVTLAPNGPTFVLTLLHGVLTVPVADELRLTALTKAQGKPWTAAVSLELEGATGPNGQTQGRLGDGETWRVTPRHHIVEATLRATNEAGSQVSATTLLPVVAGAIAARVEQGGLRVISPVPRAVVHVAFSRLDGVLALERVQLQPVVNAEGGVFHEGTLALSPRVVAALQLGPVWAVTSSEPDFASEAAVGWPLSDGQQRAAKFRWAERVDGFAQQAVRVAEHRQTWRTCAWSGLGLGCLVELGVIWLFALRAPMPVGVAGMNSGRSRWLAATVGCVILGFAGLGTLFGFW